MPRARRRPVTVSRPALLAGGSDAAFRGLIHDLIAYGHKLDACRDAFAAIAGISGVQYEILMLVSRAEGLLSVGEVAARLRERFAEIAKRVAGISDPAARAAWQTRADALDPDGWVTPEAVLLGVEQADRRFDELRGDLP